MDVTKGGGGNRSVESALKGYGYSLKCAGMLEKVMVGWPSLFFSC